jgi:autotransporter-associated beta strand protein
VIFGPTVSSGTAAVALNGVAPVLSDLVFSNSNASYWILQGTGSTGLTLAGTGSNPAAITVISGTHWVQAPILLDSNLVVSSSGSLTLGGNLSDGGLAKSLTLNGGGELILSGSNSYSGGTIVTAGTLDVTNSYPMAAA